MPHYSTFLAQRAAHSMNPTQKMILKRRLLRRRWTLSARKERLRSIHSIAFGSSKPTSVQLPGIHFHVYHDLKIERLVNGHDSSTTKAYHNSNNATSTTNKGSYNSNPASITNTKCRERHGLMRGSSECPNLLVYYGALLIYVLGPVDSSIPQEKGSGESICDGEANENKGAYFYLLPVKEITAHKPMNGASRQTYYR